MEVGLFLLGLLLGILVGWRWMGDRRAAAPGHDLQALRERAATAEARVRDLEAARDAAEARIAALDDELASARQALSEAQRRQTETGPAAEPLPQDPAPVTAIAQPSTAPPDALTRIKGIGPKLEQKLHMMGITTFQQLASLTPEEAARIDAAIEFPGRVARERWVEQARALAGS